MSSTRAHIGIAASLTILFAFAEGVEGATMSKSPSKTSDAASLQLKTGAPFLGVRGQIIRRGWAPIRMHSNDAYEYDGAEKRLVERGFLEVDSCSIDSEANCVLYYEKAGKCLRLDTIGEQVTDMKVTRWTEECPEKNADGGAK